MANVKFGPTQITNQTPLVIKRTKNALNFMAGAIVIYVPELTAMFHTTPNRINFIIGASILAVNVVGIMFGVNPTDEN